MLFIVGGQQIRMIAKIGTIFSILAAGIIAANAEPAIIPTPWKLESRAGVFKLLPVTHISVENSSGATGEYLAAKLRAATGFPFLVQTNDSESPKAAIHLGTNGAKTELGPEGYELAVEPNAIFITAPTQAGLFYGAQTLSQLFPPEIFASASVTNSAWEIPCVHIEDLPRFRWRGFMLDVSRHFFSKAEVKKILDEMALHKLNTFHWHLTDDQGWRIEIKKYPKLTQVGGWRTQSKIQSRQPDANNLKRDNDHPAWSAAPRSAFGSEGRYGGFYTQDDVREIVAYAAARHITIVPEIEMPGHAIAALAAYPELSCDHGNYSTDADAGVNKGVFCVGNDEVFKFLDDVLGEVSALFPGKYIHIGGDEVNTAVKNSTWGKCPSCQARMKAYGLKNEDELQNWFMQHIEKLVTAHGKTPIGWSEIIEGGLPPNAAVMDWKGGAVEAATSGRDVVMSPTRFCYLDYYQSLDHGIEPHAVGGFLPLEKVYSFEPIPTKLAPEFESHILGAQGNLWTEFIPSLAHAEYMMFPRLCALAEVVWSPKSARDWSDFQKRLATHELRLDQLGVNYRHDSSVKIGEWIPAQLTTNASGTNLEWNVTSQIKAPGQYRVNFEFVDGENGLVINSVSMIENGNAVALDAHVGFAGRYPTKSIYVLTLPAVKQNARYTLMATVAGVDSTGTVSWVFRKSARENSE
jgi:hexosaminidase